MTELSAFVLEEAARIQQIPAPTFDEAARGKHVARQFAALDLANLETDKAGNVYACVPGSDALSPLVLSAHLDTVFPADTDLSLTLGPNRLQGPGIGDNSIAVAALLGIARTLMAQKAKMPHDVWLVANTGEEGLGDLYGMRAVVDRFQDRPLAYVIIEGMALGQIYHRGLGVRRFRIAATTRGGHSWVDYGRPSAIHELAKLVLALTTVYVPDSPRSSLNVGTIKGGTSINTIAAQAELDLDLRSEDPATLTELASQVQALVKQASTDQVAFHWKTIGDRPAGQLDPTDPLIRFAERALIDQGLSPQLNIGSTDANIPLSRGHRAITVGVTLGQGAHTMGEYIQTGPVESGLQQILALIAALQRQALL